MKARITVTYSTVMDIGDIPAKDVQRIIEEDGPESELTIFDGDVTVEDVAVERVK